MPIPAGSEMMISTVSGTSSGGAAVVVVVPAAVEVVVGGMVAVDVDVVLDRTDVVVVGREVPAVVVVAGEVGGSVEGVTPGPLVPQAVAASTRIASIGRRR